VSVRYHVSEPQGCSRTRESRLPSEDDDRVGSTSTSEPEAHSLPRRLIALFVPRGQVGRSVAVLAGGTAASQVIFALSAPLLTRLYAPADFGALGVYTAAVGLLGVFVGLRYMLAVPLPEEQKEAVNVVALSLVVGAGMSGALGLLGVVLGGPFADIMHVPELAPYMWLLPFSLLGNCVYQTLYFWAIREQGFSVIARTRASQTIARVSVQSLLGIVGVAPLGLLLGDLAGGVTGSGSFARLLHKRVPGALRFVSVESMRRARKRFSRFAWFSTPADFLGVASIQGVPLVVAYLYGATTAGWYALTLRVVALPMTVIGVAVGETYFGIAPRLARTDPSALRSLFKKATTRLLIIGTGPTVVLMLAGPTLFSFVFGDQWETAGVYARYLAPALLAQLVASPLTETTSILERQELQLLVSALRTVLVLGTFLVAYELSWNANAALLAFSAALLLGYVAYFTVCWLLIRGLGGEDQVST
jgi:O-antigen/teichoic acid export membrane protein